MRKMELINSIFETNHGKYFIQKQLGKGKSGYSYLAEHKNQNVVLKIMHDEPCEYYSFGDNNKVDLEIIAYHKLQKCGLPMPGLLNYDAENNFLIKEFIDGIIASELIANDQISDSIIQQLFKIYHVVKSAELNIDYFPTNFIIRKQKLFYIDYECNSYSSQWNLPNWGLYYWANSQGFKQYLLTGDSSFVNESQDSGIPIKTLSDTRVATWIKRYDI